MREKLKYIVLGGNGFIGRNLCKYLYKQGECVTSFDLNECDDKVTGIEYVAGDFFNDSELKRAIMDKDVIIHAVSTINPGNSNSLFMSGYDRDLVQTVKLCSWIMHTNKKIVFLSSGGTVYGNHDEDTLTEEILPKPINHYGNVKLCIENALRIFHIQNKLNVIIARIANPYGVGQDYTKGVGFIDAVLKQSMSGKNIEIWGDGNAIRDYIYIDDVCRMIYSLIQYQGDEYLFNVSSGVGVSQMEIIEIVRSLGVKVQVEYKPARSVDVMRIVLNNSKIKEICGISCIPIREGIANYYKSLLERK